MVGIGVLYNGQNGLRDMRSCWSVSIPSWTLLNSGLMPSLLLLLDQVIKKGCKRYAEFQVMVDHGAQTASLLYLQNLGPSEEWLVQVQTDM